MKKTISVFLLLIISSVAYSQSQSFERNKISESGTGILVNGICKIQINKVADKETYYVQLTPVESFTELFVSEKNKDSFVVKSKDKTNAKFDYIVVLKRKKVKESTATEDKKQK